MAGNNLTFEFKGDASQLNAELKYTQRQIGELDRQLKKAFRAGDEAGARQLSDAIGGLQTKFTGLNRTLDQTEGKVTATGQAFRISARNLKSLDGALMGVSRNFGLFGAAAFGAYRVFAEGAQQIAEARKELLRIRDISQQTLQTPAVVKGAEDIAKSLGQAGEVADKMLGGIAESFAKVRTNAASAGAAIKDGQSTIEQGVQVLRGGDRPIFDLANAYQMLGINQRNYKGTAEGILQLQKDTMAAFQRAAQQKLFDPVQLNELSKVLFQGVPAEAALKVIPKLLKDLKDAAAKNKLTPEDIANNDALAEATNRITKMVDDHIAEHNRLWTYYETRGITAAANFVEKTVPAWVSAWEEWKQRNKEAVQNFFFDPDALGGGEAAGMKAKAENAVAEIKKAFGSLPAYFQSLGTTIGNIFTSIFDGVTKGAQKMTSGVADLIKGVERAAASAGSRAGGAYAAASAAAAGGVLRGMVPHGPTETGGYGPNSFPFQSTTPGLSDYQAPPPLRIDMSGVARGSQWSQTAAEASADAAAAAKSAAEASKMAVQGWVDPYSRYAEGGMVSGPGTATSDSITARLSTGEFVMRAAAVQRWGPSFMAALNGMGGRMPSRGIPSFASGGMVRAHGGGATVNLMFPGGTFSLRGDNETVGALTREAQRAGMLSGGRPAGVLQ